MITQLWPCRARRLRCCWAAAPTQIARLRPRAGADAGRRRPAVPTGWPCWPSRRSARPAAATGNSLWQDASADLFRDPARHARRRRRDRQDLDQGQGLARQHVRALARLPSATSNFDVAYDLELRRASRARATARSTPTSTPARSTKGEGAITRSESIELLVAAVVTDVLPNGNLVISGTQEVRVNFEVRVLNVAGIVRPRDISTDNTISYDKIAEARISYGGRGRITEVQQPAWGQQLFDLVCALLTMAKAMTRPKADAGRRERRRRRPRRRCCAFVAAWCCPDRRCGVGVGGLFGPAAARPTRRRAAAPRRRRASAGRAPARRRIAGRAPACIALPPIITNLAAPCDDWIRLEASLVFDGDAPEAERRWRRRSPRTSSPSCAP